ncbi:MAG: hypothetical protein R3C59_01725 [Planctomycetaceae bacterium]
MPQASFGSNSQTHRCEHCGGPLVTPTELREGFCSQLPCRGPCLKRMAELARAQQVRERQQRDAVAQSVRSLLTSKVDRTWTDPDTAVLVIVPRLEAEPVEPPAERVEVLRRYLEEIMAAAEEKIQDESTHDDLDALHQDRAVHEETALPVINACSTCRGKCCLLGEEHAFLSRDFFAWRLLNEPDQTPQSIIDDYLQRVPELAYEASCLFHSPSGCVLPRRIRASMCNKWICTGISDARNRWYGQPDMASVAASVDSGTCGRVGLLSGDGPRTEIEINAVVVDLDS